MRNGVERRLTLAREDAGELSTQRSGRRWTWSPWTTTGRTVGDVHARAEPAGKTDRDMHSQGVEGAALTAVTYVTSVLDVTT